MLRLSYPIEILPMHQRYREPKMIEITQPFYRQMERGTFKRKKNPIRIEW